MSMKQPIRKMTYRKEGYRCLHPKCGSLPPFKRPQELGVHAKTHKASKASPRHAPSPLAEHTVSHIGKPALLKLAIAKDTVYYLVDQDDSARIMYIDKVILATME